MVSQLHFIYLKEAFVEEAGVKVEHRGAAVFWSMGTALMATPQEKDDFPP